MKTTKQQNEAHESVDIKTDAKQAWLRINGFLTHIIAFDEDITITTYGSKIKTITLKSPETTKQILKQF